jgi:hypothetical protein
MSDLTQAWHFVGDTLRDGSPIPPDGEWLEHTGEVEVCKSGLHASERLLDALQYATGTTLCRVECDRIVECEPDKFVCRRRRIQWRVDADGLLRDFARRCAWSVLHLWEPPENVVDYLRSGDASLMAAAMHSAWAAAKYVAWDAADAADAAKSAAKDVSIAGTAAAAAKSAAIAGTAADAADAARYAAWAAVRAAARDTQNEWLTEMVEQLHAGEYVKWTPVTKKPHSNIAHVAVQKGGE